MSNIYHHLVSTRRQNIVIKIYRLFSTHFCSYPLAFSFALCQYIDMVCIYCGRKTRVVNSRSQKKSNTTWRRRECLACRAIFTSIEIFNLETSISIKDKDGNLTPFLRDKLLFSLYDSLKHRKSAENDATHLTQTVISSIMAKSQSVYIEKAALLETVYSILNRFDKAAAVHYKAYYIDT